MAKSAAVAYKQNAPLWNANPCSSMGGTDNQEEAPSHSQVPLHIAGTSGTLRPSGSLSLLLKTFFISAFAHCCSWVVSSVSSCCCERMRAARGAVTFCEDINSWVRSCFCWFGETQTTKTGRRAKCFSQHQWHSLFRLEQEWNGVWWPLRGATGGQRFREWFGESKCKYLPILVHSFAPTSWTSPSTWAILWEGISILSLAGSPSLKQWNSYRARAGNCAVMYTRVRYRNLSAFLNIILHDKFGHLVAFASFVPCRETW